ncbi:MAG: hypothetical protein ACRDIY_10150, partial [Chloroflexota bacterium]
KGERGGPAYEGQDLAAEDIFFVDARAAARGKLGGDPEAVASSGLAAFEQRLGDFLLTDRLYAHLGKSIRAGQLGAEAIDQQIGQRLAALHADERKLQEAHGAIQPQLAAIRTRRERLPSVFERYQRESERGLKASFQTLISRLRQDLPDALRAYPLPSLKTGHTKVFNQFHTKRLVREALEFCNEYVSKATAAWCEQDAKTALTPLLDRLFEEIRDEADEMERTYQDVHFQLTGWRASASEPGDMLSKNERVLSSVVGFAIVGPASLLGSQGGFRSIAGSAAAQLAAGILIAALGLSGLMFPIALAAGIIGGLGAGSWNFEERVKTRALESVLNALRTAPEQAEALIDAEVGRLFENLQGETMRWLLDGIENEERNIAEMLRLNQASRAEKERSVAGLEDARRQIEGRRAELRDLLVRLQQTA